MESFLFWGTGAVFLKGHGDLLCVWEYESRRLQVEFGALGYVPKPAKRRQTCLQLLARPFLTPTGFTTARKGHAGHTKQGNSNGIVAFFV